MNILIIAAHPDDEILGCGGSIAKWTQANDDVYVLIVAEGVTSRNKLRDRGRSKSELSQLAKSAQEANNILGVKSVALLDFADNRMDSVDLIDVIKKIESFIQDLQPQVLVTHHSGDLNIDHQIVHKAVITASRPQPGCSVKRILTFEVPSSTEWQTPSTKTAFIPNWFEDISDTLELKNKSLNIYKSEMRDWPHSRSLESVNHLARWRGASVGCEAAEAFMLIRQIN